LFVVEVAFFFLGASFFFFPKLNIAAELIVRKINGNPPDRFQRARDLYSETSKAQI